jgi:hypothetical protein
MLGVIIGDFAGSRFEFNNFRAAMRVSPCGFIERTVWYLRGMGKINREKARK